MPNVGEKNDFKLDHFYDEPSPDLFKDMKDEVKLGVRRPRALSFTPSNSDFSGGKRTRRATICQGLMRPNPLLSGLAQDSLATNKFVSVD